MNGKRIRILLAVLLAAIGLMVASAGPSLAAGGSKSHHSIATRVASEMAQRGGTQVAPNKVDHHGYSVTFTTAAAAAPSCQYKYLCVYNPGNNTVYTFYSCGYYDTYYLYGAGSYTNNQTTGTVARFYNSSNQVIVSSRAFQQGNINLSPVYHIRPC